jgi:hypothetical protein
LEDSPGGGWKRCQHCGEEITLAAFDEAMQDEAFDDQDVLSRLIHDARELVEIEKEAE